jgi:FkbM family methyltransferase
LAGRLKDNVALNGLTNVVVNEVAVSDGVGETVLMCPDPDNPGENTIVSTGADSRPTTSVPVKTTTIDAYLAERGVNRVDLVKIDIEGAELLALRGGAAMLARDDAPLFIMELNPRTQSYGGAGSGDLLGLLQQYGYAFYPIATYYSDGPNPVTNGVVAKPAHWDRFPELGKLVSQKNGAPPVS